MPQELAAMEVLELYENDDSLVILDVREPHERQMQGYIPGSVHIPMDDVEARIDELDPNKPVVVHCASGMRSFNVGCLLIEKGFKNVSNLNGGINAWTGPVEKPQ